MTHTYAVLPVTARTYQEIADLLRAAGYDHAFHEDPEHGLVIDMHGIALSSIAHVVDEVPMSSSLSPDIDPEEVRRVVDSVERERESQTQSMSIELSVYDSRLLLRVAREWLRLQGGKS